MLQERDLINNPARPQVSITRVFEAPIDLVFSMWTNAEYLARWWGPKNNTNSACEMDARPGGAIKIVMQMEDGLVVHVDGVFNEVSAPHRLVFTILKEGEAGKTGLEVLHTITLTEADGKTTQIMKVIIVRSSPEFSTSCQGMELGWNQSLDRLAEQLK